MTEEKKEKKSERKQYRFWLAAEKKELQDYLDGYSAREKLSEHIIEILEFVRVNGFSNLQSLEGLRKEKLIAEIDDIKVKTQERRARLAKDSPHTPPNPATSYNPPEEKNLEEFVRLNWNRFVDTVRQLKDGWAVSCKLCPTTLIQLPTHEIAIEKYKAHLVNTHGEELIKKNES